MASLRMQDGELEDDIFNGIECYDYDEHDGHKDLLVNLKLKAQQQLAVSPDSPFSSNDQQTNHLRIIKDTALLKQEAQKVLKERDNIKGRQNEIQDQVLNRPKMNQVEKITSKQTNVCKAGMESNNQDTKPKFRPLTGRIDCPNCSCDSRTSVCSMCIKLDRRASIFLGLDKSTEKSTLSMNNNNKKRCTLKELRQRYAIKQPEEKVVSVSERVVPGKVYTISKALDEKRVKLAQAISDLQLMKDQLREKGNRLDEERKVVQLYKDQWRYGPSIGGPKSSSRDRLGPVPQPRNYESRLDPQLARDTKAFEGFKHIEPGMKLRQYDKKTSNQPSNLSKRSKSLESLRKPKVATGNKHDVTVLSSSLTSTRKSSSDADVSGAPEVIEDEISPIDTSPPASVVEEKLQEEDGEEVDAEETEERDKNESKRDSSVQKVAWVPVFGETEIKTVRQKPIVKIRVLEPSKDPAPAPRSESRSILKQTNNKNNNNKTRELGDTNRRLVGEADRKLKFASDLLSQEREDSSTKNQLIIRKSAQKPSSSKTLEQSISQDLDEDKTNEAKIREMLLIEEKLNEHQKQIAKLLEMQQNSPPKAPKNTCCNHQQTGQHSSNRIPLGNRSLINNLRDRLNKTKTRLAKNLELEREKYMRLKLKVDTSLRKQSDLEKENELLKQSLSQCIDTCLRDITQTFESLSNSLAESVGSTVRHATDESHPELLEIYSPDSSNLLLRNAAQVMSDNNKIKDMKSRMDSVMEQRREIFNELSKEKQRSSQLELQLKRSQEELSNLLSAKQKLELRLQQEEARNIRVIPSTSSTSDPISATTEDALTQPSDSTTDDTFSGSIDRYRSYIKSLSPDLATLRQERKLILSEFDNIKKMLSEINATDT